MPERQPDKAAYRSPISAKSALIVVVALFVLILLLSSVVDLFRKYRAIRAHIKELAIEKTYLEQKKKSVTKMNDYITSTEGKEQVFRDKYRLVHPGEGMVIITSQKPTDLPSPQKPAVVRFWDSLMRGLGIL
jgi:hypothetical protein